MYGSPIIDVIEGDEYLGQDIRVLRGESFLQLSFNDPVPYYVIQLAYTWRNLYAEIGGMCKPTKSFYS